VTRSRGRSARLVALTATATALALTAAACGGGGDAAPSASAGPAAAVPAQYDLRAAGCPSTIILQTDWNPESEHGGQYELLGSNPAINASKKAVTGELTAHGGVDTGVKLEIRAGGPAIGYQTVTSQLYADSSVTLGYLGTDEQIALSKTQPTVAVMAGLEKSPQIIQWSPEKHPDWKTIADIGKTDAKVLYFQGGSYMDYLTGKGILKKSQIDGSYDGTPTHFVASGGADAVQGFATSEPYTWAHEVRAWDKPLKYQLIADTGFDFYQGEIGVRKDKLAALKPCLAKLVPIMQQGVVDFVADPAPVNKLILDVVDRYDNGWVYTPGVADYAVKTMTSLGIIGNGSNSTLGDFDATRVQKLIGILGPIYQNQNKPILAGLKPSDITDNEFLDTKIGVVR
jgi:hypothetical protein